MASAIARERRRLKLTQAQLGELVGRTGATIGRWESDPMGIDGEELLRLSELFGCSVDYLLGLDANRVPVMMA